MNEGTNDRMTSAAPRRSYVHNLITHQALMNSAVDFFGACSDEGGSSHDNIRQIKSRSGRNQRFMRNLPFSAAEAIR
jgi:hypothetical protein